MTLSFKYNQYFSLISQNIIQIRKDYKILQCVGHGSYSAVYKVENQTTHEIKCAKNVFFNTYSHV